MIGRGGEMVRFIEDNYSCTVDVKEEGVAYVYGQSQESVAEASQLINVRIRSSINIGITFSTNFYHCDHFR